MMHVAESLKGLSARSGCGYGKWRAVLIEVLFGSAHNWNPIFDGSFHAELGQSCVRSRQDNKCYAVRNCKNI